MDHAREHLLHFSRELVSIFGTNVTATIIVVVSLALLFAIAIVAWMFYQLLKFGEVTFQSTIQAIKELLKMIWYHPRQTSLAIKLELYFDAALLMVVLLSLAAMVAHALIPWVTEHSEANLLYVLVSALVLFGLFAYQSLRIADHLPAPE